MQVDRHCNFVLESLDQSECSYRLEKSGHVLDADYVRTLLFERLGHLYIVVKSVLVTALVEDVACVAHSRLCYASDIQDLVKRDLYAAHPVQRVEYTEHIDARLLRLLDELPDRVVRVVLVSYRVGTSYEHLEENVRDLTSQSLQSLPRILAEESHRNVECSAAPHLIREQVFAVQSHGRCYPLHVSRPYSGRDQGLLSVSQRCICNEHLLLVEYPVGYSLGALFLE